MDDLEPHDVVLFFPHKIQSVAITSSDKTHRINEFTRNDIHVLIIERIISPQIKIEANAIDRNRESHYPPREIGYKSCLTISDNWKPGALNHVKEVINRYKHTCCSKYHE